MRGGTELRLALSPGVCWETEDASGDDEGAVLGSELGRMGVLDRIIMENLSRKKHSDSIQDTSPTYLGC
jgi:hypothetical protein